MQFVKLEHVKFFKEIVKQDFGNSVSFFNKKMAFACCAARNQNSHNRLFKAFKIKSKKLQ